MQIIEQLDKLLLNAPETQELVRIFFPHKTSYPEKTHLAGNVVSVYKILPPVRSLLVSWLYKKTGKTCLVITPTQEQAKTFWQDCRAFLPEEKILLFPDRESIIPSIGGADHDNWTYGERVSVLKQLLDRKPSILIISLKALLRFTMPPDILKENITTVTTGSSYSWNSFLDKLVSLGYLRTKLVEASGFFSVRGGLIDLFPSGFALPIRIEWLGNDIESIKCFDPVSQRTVEPINSITILPVREYCFDPKRVENSFSRLRKLSMAQELKDHFQGEWELFKTGVLPVEFEYLYSLYYPEKITLLDYCSNDLIIIKDLPEKWEDELEKSDKDLQELVALAKERSELPNGECSHYQDLPVMQKLFSQKKQLIFNEIDYICEKEDEKQKYEITLETSLPPAYVRRFPDFIEALSESSKEKKNIFVFSSQASRLLHMFHDRGIKGELCSSQLPLSEKLSGNKLLSSQDMPKILLVPFSLSSGFVIPSLNIAAWSDKEILGKVAFSSFYRKGDQQRFHGKPVVLEDLSIGDFVVHVMYGVARFNGLETLNLEGRDEEFLKLIFANDDKLYIPVYNMEMVQKYVGTEGYEPALSRLGGKEWGNKKKKITEACKEAAEELLKTEAIRKKHPGHSFSKDSQWQNELEESFIFQETPDQMRAVQDVKEDMEKPLPMDRLVLGDAGYGKTEVALRAAFKAIMDGYQVAVLVPTTILAQQHFNTFIERLSSFPVSVELLSRFRTATIQKKIIERVAKGNVDIVIGTHRLIQKDVTFANLGLLIIDEEQRFGVKHKERLKKFRETVDILTLSATPIPRTLHMSLIGVRDLSLIETPPFDRVPVKTYLAPGDPPLIKQAIQKELDRGGQVYFLHNRVLHINKFAAMISKLLPNARICVAHGQMPSSELESVMTLFTEGLYDVLVCTTIIENGLDIPNVNTLIVNDAHLLGLAQLYQIRGRIGRSHIQAYAYFLTPPRKKLSEEACKRLETIKEFTNFGAGYQIAMRDLEIRGAGNILGTEQHGYIGAVGFHLYCQMLEDAIQKLKGGRVKTISSPVQIDLPLDAFIPDKYIEDKLLKMSAYRKLTRVSSETDIQNVKEELIDRFGRFPLPVENLLRIVKLKLLAESRDITNIYGKPSPYSSSGIRVTIEWKGKRRFAAALPPCEEVSAGDEHLSFTPKEGDDLLEITAQMTGAIETSDK